MHYQRVEATVKDIIARQFKVPYKDLAPETKLVDDLGADSLDIAEITMDLEDEFDMDIPEEDPPIYTVRDAVTYVAERLGAEVPED